MKIARTLAGATLLAMAVLAAHKIHSDGARLESMGKEVTQIREDMTRTDGEDRGTLQRALWAAVQQTPAQQVPAARPVAAQEARLPKEDKRPAPEPAQMRERMDGTFHSEQVDPGWAAGAQQLATERLRGVLPDGSEVRSLECRASLCRIETSHTDLEHYKDFVQKAFLDRDSHLWNGGMFSVPLEDASQAEGHFVVVSYLARDGQPVPAFE